MSAAASRLLKTTCCRLSPASLTRLRSGSALSSVTLGLRASAPSRSLRTSSRPRLSSSSLALPARINGPGRDAEAADTSGFSLRSLPELLRLLRGERLAQEPPCCFTCPPARLRASLPAQGSSGVKVGVVWRSGGWLRRRRWLQRRVAIEAGCP